MQDHKQLNLEAENRKLGTASQIFKSGVTGPWPQARFAAEAEVDPKSVRKHGVFSLDNSPVTHSWIHSILIT